jgi:hypothetical protein
MKIISILLVILFFTLQLCAQCERIGGQVFKMNDTITGFISLDVISVVVDTDSMNTFDVLRYIKEHKNKIHFLRNSERKGSMTFNKYIRDGKILYNMNISVGVSETIRGKGVYLTFANGKKIIKPELTVETDLRTDGRRASVNIWLNEDDRALLAESGIESWRLYTAMGSTSNSEQIKELFGCFLLFK